MRPAASARQSRNLKGNAHDKTFSGNYRRRHGRSCDRRGTSARGVEANVYEQAPKFTRLGAGIQIGCNAMKVLRSFGLEDYMCAEAFYPRSWNNKEYDSGKVRFDMIFGETAEKRYGAPYLLGHRGDLHSALASAVDTKSIHLDHRLIGIEQNADKSVTLNFANGNKSARTRSSPLTACTPS